jgi:hypothetical protein
MLAAVGSRCQTRLAEADWALAHTLPALQSSFAIEP